MVFFPDSQKPFSVLFAPRGVDVSALTNLLFRLDRCDRQSGAATEVSIQLDQRDQQLQSHQPSRYLIAVIDRAPATKTSRIKIGAILKVLMDNAKTSPTGRSSVLHVRAVTLESPFLNVNPSCQKVVLNPFTFSFDFLFLCALCGKPALG